MCPWRWHWHFRYGRHQASMSICSNLGQKVKNGYSQTMYASELAHWSRSLRETHPTVCIFVSCLLRELGIHRVQSQVSLLQQRQKLPTRPFQNHIFSGPNAFSVDKHLWNCAETWDFFQIVFIGSIPFPSLFIPFSFWSSLLLSEGQNECDHKMDTKWNRLCTFLP